MDTKEALQYNADLLAETIENFEKMFDAGQIDEEKLEAYTAQTYAEYQARVAEILGVETQEVEDVEYSDGGDYAEFSVGSQYGAALLELGEANGFDDVEEWCLALSEATGYDPNDILDVITGEIEPSDELSLDVAEALELDENDQATLLVYGIEARGEDLDDYLDEAESENEEESDESDENDADYSRVSQLEAEIAEFKATGIVKDELADIESRAWSLVDEGRVPPNVVEKLLGNFSTDSDRIAAFSTVCHKNSVDAATELYAMNKVLRVLETMPVVANFGYQALEEVSEEELEEEQALDAIANQFVKALNTNRN
ncbi:hypothetical protein [Scytonema sp. NUACC26]|uniref:hypothetical protein n=1 Tax=Scytonema sp. NUACC26 TaxID=3140176 RepID=UPI0034DC1159